MTDTVYVLNGPNLNLLGVREPHLYGHTTLAQVEQRCHEVAGEVGLVCVFRQSNHEGVLVDWVQEAREKAAGLVINPAGLSFRSIPCSTHSRRWTDRCSRSMSRISTAATPCTSTR